MAGATEARMYALWVTIVSADLAVSATLSPSNTAGYLSLVGVAAVLGVTWLRRPNARNAA